MQPTAVQFEAVSRAFGDARALDELTFAVPEGSVTALLGRNGAGKTTAMRCLVGLLRPDAGEVSVFGTSLDRLDDAARASIGYVSERQHLDPRLTIGETLEFTRAFYRTWDDGLALDLVDRLGLDPVWSVGSLSLGEGRKVALALNLAFRPRLLVLDEPAANLDAVVRREFLEVVLDMLRAEGMTVLYSTHLLPDVERVADRVVLIERGRRRLESNLDDLKDGVKTLRLVPRNGRSIEDLELPGTLRRRRTGDELLVTVEAFDDGRAAAAAEAAGATVDVVDLPLEEIFIAYGGDRS